jgi:Zn-finger nucleic acid-binding protein
MARCPVCGSVRVVLLVAPSPRAFCARCGSRWIQEGNTQRRIERAAVGQAASVPRDPPA